MAFDSNSVIHDLYWLAQESELRCITDAEQWANEVLYYLPNDWLENYEANETRMPPVEPSKSGNVTDRVTAFGRALVKNGDFYRAEFFLEKVKTKSLYHQFVFYWARYLAYERHRLENDAESLDFPEYDHSELISLHAELCRLGEEGVTHFDAFLFYVLGKVRLSLKLKAAAKDAFLQSVLCNRAFWPSWEELVCLVDSPQEAEMHEFTSGDHWMYRLFKADVLSRFYLHKNALEEYERISEAGFAEMPYLVNKMAAALNALQEHDSAWEFFEKVRKSDPRCVTNMHLYSDTLYVRGLCAELSALAHDFYLTHKFRWETCCIVANYYSLRGDHERATIFLQRSLKLNPYNASVWTLIGHEFMEQKNNAAACIAYRKAIAADAKDYRGWYGLGQLYDILKMHSYALHYYQRAHMCKPDDSRMLVALGEIYTRLERFNDAQKCFLKAYKVGDVEGTALMLLGGLYARHENEDAAALAYEKYLDIYGEQCMDDEDNVSTCCSFLASHYLKKNELTTASAFAQRCLEYETSKEHGRNILRQISQIHHRLGGNPLELPGGATSTPTASIVDLGKQLKADTQQLTPILPQTAASDTLMEFRLSSMQTSREDPNAAGDDGPPVLPREEYAEEGEADMAISSDEESD